MKMGIVFVYPSHTKGRQIKALESHQPVNEIQKRNIKKLKKLDVQAKNAKWTQGHIHQHK